MGTLFRSQPDDKIVVFGMSCSGKTTFAKQLVAHNYVCFDALFPWHIIETFGLSVSEGLNHVSKNCIAPFVLDGWLLADKECRLLPEGTRVYLVYAPYEQIVDQYRVKVFDRSDYTNMFHKWYHEVDYHGARYFLNCGDFVETSEEDFAIFLARNQRTASSSGTLGIVPFLCS